MSIKMTNMGTYLSEDLAHPVVEVFPPAVTRRSVASLGIPSIFEMLEETAYDLAVLAGEHLIDSLGRSISVRYKDERRGIMAPHDVVSDVDEEIESILRRRLAARHPDQISSIMPVC